MKVLTKISFLTVAIAVIAACDKTPQQKSGDGTLRIVTKVCGTDNLNGLVYEDAPNWGLYGYTPEGEVVFENACMEQAEGDLGYSDEYKASKFVGDKPENTSALGGMILSAYYPYIPTSAAVPNNFPLDDDDISPRLTTNSLGHPAIHYGTPDYRVARHPKGVGTEGNPEGYFDFNYGKPGEQPNLSVPARKIVLFSCYKHANVEDLNTTSPVQIELAPVTCRLAFTFSIAPRFDENGVMRPASQQPNPADYEIISVRRRRTGYRDPGGEVAHTNFNYDLKTGKITDMRFKTGGQCFVFPKEGDDGYNPAWGPVNPYAYDVKNEDMVPFVEFVGIPALYDDLKKIEFEIVFRYRLIDEGHLVDQDVWVENTSIIHADTVYLFQGWRSGVVYRYHIYISRHEVDYDVEVLPWEFDPTQDQFFGDIQV